MTAAVKRFDEGGWVDNGDGTWTAPDGMIMDEEGNEITDDYYTGGGEEDLGGWVDNGDGSWTYTDENGDMQRINEDGTEWQADGAALPPVTVTGKKDPAPTEKGIPRIINGIEYTQREDGQWVDDEGIVYTDDEIDAETHNPTPIAEEGATWTRNPDGSYSQKRPDGLIITKNNDGTTTTQNPGGSTHTTDKDGNTKETTPSGQNPNGVAQPPTSTGGPSGIDKLIDKFKTPDGGGDWAKLLKAGLAAGVGIQGLKGVVDTMQNKNQSPDYQGQIDMGLTFNRTMNPQDPNRRPGSASTPFFASNTFGPAGSAPPKGIAALPAAPINDAMMYLGGSKNFNESVPEQNLLRDARVLDDGTTVGRDDPRFAQGGIAQLAYAQGGETEPRYLRGDTDGMADEVKARIDGGQEARLAHGEFVIPADVVSHLGNGNSDAGAKKLYQMMDKLRVARTGTKQQGKEINPDKFLPGMPRMACGGITDVIPRFAEGGTAAVTGGTAAVTGVNSWAGPYATNLLSQTNALGNDMIANPGNYVYQGQRVADTNALQAKAYQGAMNMDIVNPGAKKAGDMMESFATRLGNMPEYQAASVGSGYAVGPAYEATKFETKDFDQEAAKRYMNPYLKESLDPQLAEARRQAEISRMTNAGRLVGSGAFGGGRQAIMEAEGDRNLGQNLAAITGKGYDTAYTNAMAQFNADGSRRLEADKAGEQSKQFGHSSSMTDRANSANFGLQAAQINENSRMQGARLGLDSIIAGGNMASNWGNFMNNADTNTRNNLSTISGLGNNLFTQQQSGLTADMNRFNEEAALPGQALKFKKDMLTGLPVQNTTAVSPGTSLSEQLAGLGLSIDDISKLMGTT